MDEVAPIHAVAPRRPRDRVQTYPLARPFLLVGIGTGLVVAAIYGDLLLFVAVLTLFVTAGITWRSDMPPILPFCFFFQWLFACLGYIFFSTYGYYPGGGDTTWLRDMLPLAMLGLIGLAVGLRLGFLIFKQGFEGILRLPDVAYDPGRLALLSCILFATSYFYSVSAQAISIGGAQIINNLLALRFVPYFVLLIYAFRTRTSFWLVAFTTLFVLLPQFLTGFSNFKELFFAIFLAAAAQWRPWIRTREQARVTRKVMAWSLSGAVAIIVLGLVWQGGVKAQWRNHIWSPEASASPAENLKVFGDITSGVIEDFEFAPAFEDLAARMSSGSLYFSYVIRRVPAVIPHEDGALTGMAIANAVSPRFLFPEKESLGGDSWLVRRFAGIEAAGNESGASIGLGYMAEFYVDFGTTGLFLLCVGYGLLLACALLAFALFSPSREVFLGLSLALLLQYFLSFDGSFIKLFSGLIQQTIIFTAMIFLFGRPLNNSLSLRRRRNG